MRFISDIGRPWTIREMERAIRLHKQGHHVLYIAVLLLRNEKEIMAIL